MFKLKDPLFRRGVLLGIFCVILLGWNMALSTYRKNSTGKVLKLKKESVVLKVTCPGKVEPKIKETLRAEVEGRKESVLVKEGERVKRGQLLIRISDERIRIELSQKKSAFQNSRSDMIQAKKDYQLERSLYRQQAVPKQEVETKRMAYIRAKQDFQVAKEEFKITEKKAKGVKVFSPIDGIVLKIFISKDQWISSGKELITVAELGDFVVRGRVDELDIAQVAVGQESTIELDAFPNNSLAGQVSLIGAQAAEGAFAEIEIEIEILDTQGLDLKSGLSAEATIVTGRLPEAIILPARGVRNSQAGPYVLKVWVGGWLKKQPVVVKSINADRAIIKSGLIANDSVLIPEED